MKTLLRKYNRCFILLMALAMVFSSVFSAALAERPKAESANPAEASQAAVPASLVYMVIVHDPVPAETQVVLQPKSGAEICGFTAQAGILQGSVGTGLFNNPASCFSLGSFRPQTAFQPLEVYAKPNFVPQVVFYDFSQKIRSELNIPVYPAKEQVGTLPGIVFAGLLVLFVFFKRESSALKPVDARPFVKILSPENLQVMRC